jgi:hypothetical protein
MPGGTPERGYPYPLGADPIDIAGDIKRLAERLEEEITYDAWVIPIYGGLSHGWATGLMQISADMTIPPTRAAPKGVLRTWVCAAQYWCTGSAGQGADLSGANIRTRFRINGADQGISGFRVAHSDQCMMIDTLQMGRDPGAAAATFNIWAETDKSMNVTGSFTMIGYPVFNAVPLVADGVGFTEEMAASTRVGVPGG